MARRSRKTLQAEGQLSLFAMTDDFLFAVTENTENAVDKAAESRSYVNHEPPFKRVVCSRPIRPRDTGQRLKALPFSSFRAHRL